ncbi:hypothetical protein [Desulfomarina sp.]
MEFIPFSKIIKELQKLSKQNETGTFYITSDTNRSAQIMLVNGEITFIYCFNRLGMKGLEQLKTIDNGRFRFQAGSGFSKKTPLPSTAEIFRTLSVNEQEDAVDYHDRTTEKTARQISGKIIEKTLMEQMHKAIIEVVGPAADILIEDALDSLKLDPAIISETKFRELIVEITKEIPGNKQKIAFEKIMSRLI